MRIARIEIENWRCFRGEHVVGLDPGAHAVIARHERDGERSNWLGKSSLLWAIRFALTGDRPEDCRTEDDWITRGEASGSVAVVLDDGTRIERSRARGGPTVPEVIEPDGARFRKAEAQPRIDQILGLTADDAPAWFFAQKTMDRFVRARPGERAAEVASWLRLEKLVAAEDRARSVLSGLVREETDLAAEEKVERATANVVLVRAGLAADTPAAEALALLDDRRRAADELSHRCETRARELEEHERRAVEIRASARRRTEREELARETAQAERDARRAENASPSPARLKKLRDEHEHAESEARAAEMTAGDKRVLACGGFDGRCPVGGVTCPISAELNARQTENAAAAREAAENASGARQRAETSRRAKDAAESLLRAAETARARASTLRTRLDRLPPEEAPAEPAPEVRPDEMREAREEASRARDEARDLARAADDLRRLAASSAEREKKLADLRSKIRTARDAVAVLKKSRRRIAEGAVAEIETGANVLLARSGVALSVRIAWERETKGLATACDECGSPFGASTKIKTCVRCGAERGPKIDERLDVVLSDRSGAAEDLAGVAISLAASARLRTERGSSWGLVCLDEPFGALDRAHRRALSRGLVAMLRGQWEQALVIAHDDSVMDGMPGRVVVVGGENGSRIERG